MADISAKISAVIPVYNTPPAYLQQCIESVLAQQIYSCQVILVDDGSNEQTAQLCNQFAKESEKIIVVHQKNAGPGVARNTGLQQVQGEYLTFVDADDTLCPNTWRYVLERMAAQNADCAIFGWLDNEAGTPQEIRVSDVETVMRGADTQTAIAGDDRACGGGYLWNKIWRTDGLRDVNTGKIPEFISDLFTYEDKEWVLRALNNAKKVLLLPEIFYDYRFVAQSLTKEKASDARRQYEAYRAHDRILENLAPVNSEAYRAAAQFYFDRCWRDLWRQIRHFPKFKQTQRKSTKRIIHQVCRKIRPDMLQGVKRKILWYLGWF